MACGSTSPCPNVFLDTIRVGSRQIAYSTVGDPSGSPVLFFYPAGGNRRMLHMFEEFAKAASLRFICVNRPGKGGTSRSLVPGPEAHVDTVCVDTLSVLSVLRVDRASVLFMCEGTPFALSFAARYPQRVTTKLLGVAPWIQPADTSPTKTLYRVGAGFQKWFISPLMSSCISSLTGCTSSSLSSSLLLAALLDGLTASERASIDTRYPNIKEFARRWAWTIEELGGSSRDMSVALSGSSNIGFDYMQVSGQVLILHVNPR
eukprot:TRINITY_DN10759_c0_g1_i6.p1 TRINITY_DN10759_c0_g1~~TRINITY_DN10759_c0_g1_i6.p1  ORF type:complete len:278 (+),score=9.95 TRINITY_DN10759_c0_g1_i6:53-835(+)